MEVDESMSITDKERLVDELAQELYQAHRAFRPRFPHVLLMTLTKEQQRGSIIIPETEQNKPVHEGIVLVTWAPFVETKTVGGKPVSTYKESELKPGDHVLFHHFAGFPVLGYRDQRYRCVKEEGWDYSTEGGIFMTVDYGETDRKPVNKMEALLKKEFGNGGSPEFWSQVIGKIEHEFMLIDRDTQSVTLSGR